jgi:hypothetical protein
MSIVRTAYAFTPTSITGCSLWLDAADSSTITIQTGVSQWTDKSGQGRHVTQSTTSLQPVYSSVSNALVFNSNAWLGIPNALAAITPTYTIFVVDKRASASVHFFIGMHTNTGANVALILGYNGTTTSHHTTAHITDCMVTIPAYAGAAEPKRLARYDYTGSIRDTYINGGQLSTIQSFSATLPTWNNANIGAGYYIAGTSGLDWWYVGNIHEIIFYNNVLTTGQAQQVEAYLSQKWGLTSSLPTVHPGLTSRVYRSDYLVPNRLKPTPYYTFFSPRQIPGLVVWLDGADPAGNGVIPANGSTISTWTDKSGNGNNGTAVNTPTYSVSSRGVATSSGAYFSLPNGAFPFNDSSYTYFFVFTTTTTGSVNSLFGGGVPGTTRSTVAVRLGTNGANNVIQTYWWSNGINDLLVSNTYSANTISIAETWYATGSTRTITLNFAGSSTDSPAVPGARLQANTNNYLGLAYPGDGALTGFHYEFLVYNTSLSTTQRQQIESYLSQKWGLTTSIPVGHSHLTQQAGAVTTTALSKFKVTGLPRILFASTGLVITHQDGRTWKATANNPGYANYAIGLNSGASMSLNIYAGSDVYNSAGGRVALLYNGDTNNAVRHAGYVMWTSTFAANNFDFGWKFVSSGSGYLIYNDYPSIGSAWQVTYDPSQDRVLIQPPGAATYGMVWNITPRVTLAYVYSSY